MTSTRHAMAMAVVAILGFHDPIQAKEPDLCTQTSRAVRRACESEALDDQWIAVGVCTNLGDDDQRKTCRRTAKQTLQESRAECGEQFDAREQLCDAVGQAAYAPPIDPSRFRSPQAAAMNPNPLFPLVPGTIWVYTGGGETITVTVTGQTKVIQGVACIVVHDVVVAGGQLVEDTLDYYAQDVGGSVWYFGELSQSFENGELVDIEGSFTAGVNGAKAGVVMEAAPAVGDVYRQEFALGGAEDAGEILDVAASETVPAASCTGTCLVTRDFTPLEPGHVEHKYYKPGVGQILGVNLETGVREELVSFTPGMP